MVEVQQTAKKILALARAGRSSIVVRSDELAVETLVGPHVVVVRDVLSDGLAEMGFAEWDDVI